MGLILKEEGLRGLLAGVSVTASYAGPASATYFAAYHALKDRVRLHPRRRPRRPRGPWPRRGWGCRPANPPPSRAAPRHLHRIDPAPRSPLA